MKKQKEYRSFSFELASEGRTAHIRIPYNSRSECLGGFYEILSPEVFKKTLQENSSIRVLVEHDDRLLLARSDNGSLRITNTPDALEADFDIPETTLGNDLLVEIKSGLITGASFGFIVVRDDYKFVDGDEVRTVLEAKLLELSVVRSIPAYSGTSVSVRSLSQALEGQEINDDAKSAIQAEIDKLQAMLPKEEPKEEIKEEIKEEVKEEIKEEVKEEIKEPEVDQAALDELQARLEAAEKIICGE